MSNLETEVERQGIAVIRALAMDGPHKANSGHQGTAMALAPLAHVLYTRVMRYDASVPEWQDRDRLVLSAGHASILLYSMLHLTGFGVENEDLQNFRQIDSATPGHPEAGHTPGVEVTTGPLGQGIANSVGLAMAELHNRSTFGEELCNHWTYVIAGDGDLSEGISHEAASLAGHLGLGRLVVVYDDNHISIDGPTELSLSDDAAARFAAYGWDVNDIGEVANDVDALEDAVTSAKEVQDKPSLIILRSHIGYPSKEYMDTSAAHGKPFGDKEIATVKKQLGLPEDKSFWVPDEVLAMYRDAGVKGNVERKAWEDRFENYSGDKSAWEQSHQQTVGSDWQTKVEVLTPGTKQATRQSSQQCITAMSANIAGLIGGSADLTGSNGTKIGIPFSKTSPEGQQIHFGVREHAMGAALVGMAQHGGVTPFGGTFLVFADYMRPSIRLAAMSKSRCVFVFTHDSVGVGEDGPTHQPIEQVMSLRTIPGLQVLRPADLTETMGAWQAALNTNGPTALILSRQGLPELEGTSIDGVQNGAYIVVDSADPDVVLLGTGSETSLCVDAAEQLKSDGISARVVSMPSWERYEALGLDAQERILPSDVPTVSVEAGVTLGWERHADIPIGIDRFGISGPGSDVLKQLGMNADNITATTKNLLSAIHEGGQPS